MYRLVLTSSFKRQLRKFLRKHPDLRQQVADVLRDLEVDPFQQHLRIHGLNDNLRGLHAVRVTHSYRITLSIKIEDQEIVLLDIGGHDEVYR